MADTMEETEFKAFCAELKKESPDMDKIKAGMEKYGMGQLSDAQKATFMAAMFPAPIAEGAKESEKLGFQNLNGIKNALNAMQQLQAEGKIDNDQMKAFLTEPNPENGKSVMTTVALETRAVEFKGKRMTDPDAKDKLAKNLEVTTDIQKTLGKLDYHTLMDAANTPDATKPEPKKYSNYLKTSQGQKSQLNDSLKESAENAPLEINGEEETMKIGGNENTGALTIDGKAKPLNVKVQAPQEEQNEEENPDKVATLDDGGRDSQHGKGDFHFSPVEEQDIINYMFKAWVIGGLNAGLEGTFKFGDWLVRAAIGGGERAPRASAVASQNQGSAGQGQGGTQRNNEDPTRRGSGYVDRMVDLGTRSSQAYNNFLLNGNRGDLEQYFAAMTQTVAKNIGKEVKDWKPIILIGADGKQEMPFKPSEHKEFIKQLNEIYQNNPEDFKKLMTQLPKTLNRVNSSFLQNVIVSAGQLQAIDFAAKNLGDSLEGKAEDKIRRDTLGKVNELLETAQQIQKKNTAEIVQDPNKKPTPEEQKKIAEATAKEFKGYMKEVAVKADTLRNLLGEHYEETDPTKKAALKKQIEAAKKEYDAVYNRYRNPNGDEKQDDKNKDDKGKDDKKKDDKKKDKPMGPDEAAREEERARDTDRKRTEKIDRSKAELEAEREVVTKRKERVEETKKRTGHDKKKTQTRTQTPSRIQAMATLPKRRRGMGGLGG